MSPYVQFLCCLSLSPRPDDLGRHIAKDPEHLVPQSILVGKALLFIAIVDTVAAGMVVAASS